MRLLISLLINAAALWVAASLLSGIHYTGAWPGLVGLALVFGVVNTFVRPILSFLSFPIQLVTLGLFTLVLNAAMLLLTARLGRAVGIDFRVDSFGAALLGAIIVSLVGLVLGAILAPDADD
jgi:putative membrane protein